MENPDSNSLEIIKAENCPKDIKKRLKKMAIDKEIAMQDLIVEYCRAGLEKDETDARKSRK